MVEYTADWKWRDKGGAEQVCDIVEVYTLGRFMVRSGDMNYSQKAIRSNKMWELFKFLLSNRGRNLPPDVILDNLWPEKEYVDPKSAFRVQINRMKHAIGEDLFNDGKININFSHGCYCLETGPNCRLDIDEMEDLSQQASELALHDPKGAINTYLKALSLYRGDYFPDIAYNGWVLPFRNYYRCLYLLNVMELIKLLKRAGLNSEIIKVCEKVFFVELFEEDIHICYMKALLEEGKEKQALAHYQYITSLMYREIGAKPSEAMRNIYRLLKMEPQLVELDITQVQEMLMRHEETGGAFICDPEFFRFLYKLERRWSQRMEQEVLLALLTVNGTNHHPLLGAPLAEAMLHLKQALTNSLRTGDVISQWNELQFIMLLPGLTLHNSEEVLNRIKSKFYQKYSPEEIILHYNLQSIFT